MRSSRMRRSAAVAVALTIALTACGGDGDADVADEPVATPEETEDLAMKPEFDVASAETPPTELVVEDLVVGEGQEAQPGDTVEVHYVGKSWSTGEQFDASWDRGQTFQFTLGAGMVIRGWDEGVAGMKVGGRRKLVIPPDLGYGEQGAGGVIGPNETLVFVVDLVAVP